MIRSWSISPYDGEDRRGIRPYGIRQWKYAPSLRPQYQAPCWRFNQSLTEITEPDLTTKSEVTLQHLSKTDKFSSQAIAVYLWSDSVSLGVTIMTDSSRALLRASSEDILLNPSSIR